MKCIRKGDNRGITLVEVIVSMLVLAIIVVPLLSSFVLSSRVNVKARSKQYATILARNVMESLKNYDLEEVALQFNGKGGTFQIVPTSSMVNATYGHGFYETNPIWNFMDVKDDLTNMSIGMKIDEYYFKGNTAKTYHYVMNQVKEGTKEFDLHITISAAPAMESGKQNDYAMPDLTNLDINETAVINPGGVGVVFKHDVDGYFYNDSNDTYEIDPSSTSYDQDAILYFYDQHQKYVAKEKNDAILAGLTPPSLSRLDISEIQKRISRKTIITIEDIIVENKILVSAKLEYKFHQGSESLIYTVGEIPTNDTIEYGGFYELVGFDHLENIYLFHTPLSDRKCSVPKGDVIEVNNQSFKLGDDLKIFISQQMVDGRFDNIEAINVFAYGPGGVDKLKFYYNKTISNEPLVSYDPFLFPLNTTNNFLVTDGEVKDRFYEVKVQVMEHGFTEVLNELTSTVTR